MTWRVRFTPEAEEDLVGRYDFLAAREVDAAERALAEIRKALEMLRLFSHSCRRAEGAKAAAVRELIVPFGNSGYVLLFEIEGRRTVTVSAARHQREDDYR